MSTRTLRVEVIDLDTGWMAHATCAGIPGLPWIDSPRRVPMFVAEVMARVCAGCPVLGPCRDFVVAAEITAGFWAGESRNGLGVQDVPRRNRSGRGEAA